MTSKQAQGAGEIVNAYFKRFYPTPLDPQKMRFSDMLGGMWSYEDHEVNKIFPPMVCADGFKMSVQGHCGAYSQPRDDFAKEYRSVEVGFPSKREEALMPYIDGDGSEPTETVYGYVPVEVVEQIIAAHGGLVPATLSPEVT